MNPCPCGYHGDNSGRCRCNPEQIRRYQGKISGPLLDRLDLHVEVTALAGGELTESAPQVESSAQVRERVLLARQHQHQRRGKVNAHLSPSELEQDCPLSAANRQLMEGALNRLGLSARAYHRVLRVARTVADLQGALEVDRSHLLESLGYRTQERTSLRH